MTAPDVTTAVERVRLREMAKLATPGPWEFWDALDARPHSVVGPTTWRRDGAKVGTIVWVSHHGLESSVYSSEQTANAQYIAAANPETITALLDELDRLAAALGEARDAISVTRSLVSEGACVGFVPTDGDWAERLFANQARLTALAPLSAGTALQQQEARDGRE